MELFLVVVEKFWIPILATLATAVIKERLAVKPKLIFFFTHASSVSLLGLNVPPPAGAPAQAAGTAAPGVQGNAAQALPVQAAANAVPAANAPLPPPVINSHSILLRNVGKQTAYGVRIGHNQVPLLGYQIQPTMAHQVLAVPTGGWEIVIPTLVPNELVQIAYVYDRNVTWNMIHSHIKSNAGAAETLNVVPVQLPSVPYRFFRAMFVYIGIFALTYALFLAGQWLYSLRAAVS